jgi:hypothetical protein
LGGSIPRDIFRLLTASKSFLNCLMRHRDPHDDPPAKRRPAPYRGPPVTLAHMRAQGVRRLLIYCSAVLYCHHSGTVDADRWPDETALRDLCPKAVCTQCGIIGADVRPDWSERTSRESLTGGQWRWRKYSSLHLGLHCWAKDSSAPL